MERWHVVGVVIALVLIGLALGSVRARAGRDRDGLGREDLGDVFDAAVGMLNLSDGGCAVRHWSAPPRLGIYSRELLAGLVHNAALFRIPNRKSGNS